MGETPLRSTRLARFTRSVQGSTGIEAAWRALTAPGVPLTEPVRGSSSERLVTFVWRPSRPVRAASVYSPIMEYTPVGTALAPFGETGVWYRSVRLPATVRASYGFAPRRLPALTDPGRAWGQFFHALGPDPLNPRRVRIGERKFISEFALPRARAQPWGGGDARRDGTEDRRRFRSRKLGNTRTVWVGRPPRFDPRRRSYNLLIVFDGPAYQDPIPTRRILANLVAAGRLDPTVVVLVDNARGARERDLSANPTFPEFLAGELLPWLIRRYGIRTEARRTVLAGSSLGGLAAAHAALEHPNLFGGVLAQSGAFLAGSGPESAGTRSVVDRYSRSQPLPVRFYLDAGTYETIVPPGGSMSLLDGARRMRDVLRRKGYDLAYAEFSGGHDYVWWRGTLADGLLFLLGRPRKGRARDSSHSRPG